MSMKEVRILSQVSKRINTVVNSEDFNSAVVFQSRFDDIMATGAFGTKEIVTNTNSGKRLKNIVGLFPDPVSWTHGWKYCGPSHSSLNMIPNGRWMISSNKDLWPKSYKNFSPLDCIPKRFASAVKRLTLSELSQFCTERNFYNKFNNLKYVRLHFKTIPDGMKVLETISSPRPSPSNQTSQPPLVPNITQMTIFCSKLINFDKITESVYLPNITHLFLSQFSSSFLRSYGKNFGDVFPNLTHLSVVDALSDFLFLTNLPKLEYLRINYYQSTSNPVSPINLPSLQTLVVSPTNSSVSFSKMHALLKNTKLSKLVIRGAMKLSKDDFVFIGSNIPHLTDLRIQTTDYQGDICDFWITSLLNLNKNFRVIKIPFASSIPDSIIPCFSKLENLEKLCIVIPSSSRAVRTDHSLGTLSSLPRLSTLCVGSSEVTGSFLQMGPWPSLSMIKTKDCNNFDLEILATFNSTRESGCPHICHKPHNNQKVRRKIYE